jgi:hypothetical protein
LNPARACHKEKVSEKNFFLNNIRLSQNCKTADKAVKLTVILRPSEEEVLSISAGLVLKANDKMLLLPFK